MNDETKKEGNTTVWIDGSFVSVPKELLTTRDEDPLTMDSIIRNMAGENPPTPYDTGLGDTPPVRIWATYCFPSRKTGESCGDWVSSRSAPHVFEYVRVDVTMRATEEEGAGLRAEIARLTAERDEANARAARMHRRAQKAEATVAELPHWFTHALRTQAATINALQTGRALPAELAEAREQRDKLAEALREARVAVEAWGAYAHDYFQEKHGLADDLAAIDAALARLAPLPTRPEPPTLETAAPVAETPPENAGGSTD